MAEELARTFGTEADKVNCPFYFKIGFCIISFSAYSFLFLQVRANTVIHVKGAICIHVLHKQYLSQICITTRSPLQLVPINRLMKFKKYVLSTIRCISIFFRNSKSFMKMYFRNYRSLEKLYACMFWKIFVLIFVVCILLVDLCSLLLLY